MNNFVNGKNEIKNARIMIARFEEKQACSLCFRMICNQCPLTNVCFKITSTEEISYNEAKYNMLIKFINSLTNIYSEEEL
jgi:hypothetical protein